MDGNNIKDFIITPDYEIQIYTRHNKNEKRVLKKKYWLQNDGRTLSHKVCKLKSQGLDFII
jgi:hypothetical protein